MPKICPVCGATYPDSNIFCATDGTTLRAADAHGDLIGSVIADRYLVTDLLGEGGMGKVYLARHVRLPQQAAIKVLRAEQVRDASSIARFNREAANASRIDHDRVARVYDFGETSDGIVYLAMEFVAGRTLKAILAASGPMVPRRAANVVRQIADGLDAAHRLGIVHRDLKPDNVLLIEGEAADGSDDRVKVVDFGIAKALGGDGAGEPGLTRTGYVVGTPEFMSPEQLLGNAVDARSDVYALAIVAYQCLTGDLPFDIDSADRGMTARLMNPPRPLAVVRTDVPWPAAVQAVFDAGLAREATARPASAGAFARALATAVDEWNAESSAATRAAPAVGASAGHGVPTTPQASAAPATAPVAAPVVTAVPAEPRVSPDATAAAPPVASPRRRPVLAVAAGAVLVAGVAGVMLSRRAPAAPEPVGPAPAAVSTAVTPPAVATPAATVPAAPASATPGANAPASTGSGATAPAAVRTEPTPRLAAQPAAAVPRAAPAVASTVAPAARTSGSAAGRHTLDSITEALDPNNPDPRVGRAAVGALRGLLPRLTNANDSAWALVRTVEANLIAGDQGRACAAIRSARAAARSDDQREAIHRYDAVLECP